MSRRLAFRRYRERGEPICVPLFLPRILRVFQRRITLLLRNLDAGVEARADGVHRIGALVAGGLHDARPVLRDPSLRP